MVMIMRKVCCGGEEKKIDFAAKLEVVPFLKKVVPFLKFKNWDFVFKFGASF